MKNKKVDNQTINDNEGFTDGEGYPSCEGTPCDNVTEGEESSTATMSEPAEQAAEEAPANDFEREAAEWRDKYIRLQAEFDNFRKRTLREKMDLVQSGGADVLKSMLSVLDDIYRAMDASQKSDDITSLREGEKLVAQKFCDALRQKGVTEIEAQDKEFDSDLHEAVARFAAGEDMRGKVIDVVQRGYMLGEKVLRYAKVVVGE
ncbi:MAG: nucleotide exchange factor GrpE [Alistipes sp.]|nr:nucleotide exchange factor GrpE [Alistipes sp.]